MNKIPSPSGGRNVDSDWSDLRAPDRHSEESHSFPFDLLSSIGRSTRDALCITDADFEQGLRILHVNPAFTTLTGWSPAEMAGRGGWLLGADEAVFDRLALDLVGGLEAHLTAPRRRRDGTEFVMDLHLVPIRSSTGRIRHLVGVLRDADEERATRARAELFRATLENTADAVAILDHRGRVAHVNPALVTASGHSEAELLGRSVRETGLTPRRLRVYRDVIKALTDGNEWRGEYEASGRCGEPRRLMVAVTRADAPDTSQSYVITARDVTHQRRLEYIAEARNFVENVGYAFAGIRHELGNPINSIKTALTVLRQSLHEAPRERVEDYLDRVLQEMSRVEYLLRSLQSFNTMTQLNLEATPVGEFLANFSKMIRQDTARRGVDLIVQVEEDVGSVMADPRALHQVMLNLVTNAMDALGQTANPRIRITARRGASHVRLTVSDNGPGIPLERRPLLFKPFHTTKSKGTGLGLAITRKLVTLMGGTIGLESSAETTMVVTLDPPEPTLEGQRRPSVIPPRPLSKVPPPMSGAA